MKKQNLQTVQLNDLLFDVEMRDNPRNTNSEYAKVVTGIIDGQEIDLNYCSDRYALVPNADIFPVVRQILVSHNIHFTESYQHLNNARFYADYVIEDKCFAYKISGSNGDMIKPKITVRHSYNGLTKYVIVFGYYRLICSNGMVIAVEEMKEYNLHLVGKHTESIKNSLLQLNNTMNYFAQNAAQITAAITAKYDTLAGNFVANVDDRITEILNKSKIVIIDNSKFDTLDYIKEVINSEKDLYNGRVNDWLIYNGINRYIHDNKLNVKAPEVRTEMDSKVFEYMLQTN